jgi:hypothetical protein
MSVNATKEVPQYHALILFVSLFLFLREKIRIVRVFAQKGRKSTKRMVCIIREI